MSIGKVVQAVVMSAALVLLSGCAASGERFAGLLAPEDGDGVLYVYRPWDYVNAGMAPYVYIDGEAQAALKSGGYQVYRLAPGSYSVVTQGYFWEWNAGRGEVVIELAPGQTAYVKLASGLAYRDPATGLIINPAGLHEVSEALATEELPVTRLSD